MLSPNMVIPYNSTPASIPNGFTREAILDGRYPKGWSDAEAPGGVSGNATHIHTTPAHTHTANHHTHTTPYTDWRTHKADGARAGGDATANDHRHDNLTNDATQGSVTNTFNYSAYSNDPPYYTVIFIRASGGYRGIPPKGMVFRHDETRTRMTFHLASAGKYLKGAIAGAGAGEVGGTYNNTHSIAHTHTISHTHTGRTAPSGSRIGTSGDQATISSGHTHAFILNAVSHALLDTGFANQVQFDSNGNNIEPAFQTLNVFENLETGDIRPETGDIVLWLGSIATVPRGWKLCDGTDGTPDMRNKFAKIRNTAVTAPTSGGSHTHSHPGVNHNHNVAGASHAHYGYAYNAYARIGVSVHNDGWREQDGHDHGIGTLSSYNDLTVTTVSVTPDVADNQPPYVVCAYIQMRFFAAGASLVSSGE